jgi:hypothetical protein
VTLAVADSLKDARAMNVLHLHAKQSWVWRPHGRTFTRPSGLCRPWNETPVALGLRTRILRSA